MCVHPMAVLYITVTPDRPKTVILSLGFELKTLCLAPETACRKCTLCGVTSASELGSAAPCEGHI